MVVVALAGMLMAMAVAGYGEIRNRVRENQARVDLELLCAAIEQMAWDTGNWPNGHVRNDIVSGLNIEVWDLSVASAGLISESATQPPWNTDSWRGPYIDRIPKTDPWGVPYFFDPDYRIGSKIYPVVGSFGRNRSGRNLYDQDDIVAVCQHEGQ